MKKLKYGIDFDTATGKIKLQGVSGAAKKLTDNLKTVGTTGKASMGQLVSAAAAVVGSLYAIKRVVGSVVTAYNKQETAEKRLETTMTAVSHATKEQIQETKKLARELQNVSVVGDEVSLSGASQLATFNMSTDAIQNLLPSLNTLSVANYGVKVSQEQNIQTANLLGKAFQGQVGALSRVGISFTDYQSQMLKNGSESEKVAVMAEVINQNFGDLAVTMKDTSEGAIQVMINKFGDLKEQFGERVIPALSKGLKILNTLFDIVSENMQTVFPVAVAILTIAIVGLTAKIWAMATAVTAATGGLNLVLAAVAALGTAGYLASQKQDDLNKKVDTTGINANIATGEVNKLTKAQNDLADSAEEYNKSFENKTLQYKYDMMPALEAELAKMKKANKEYEDNWLAEKHKYNEADQQLFKRIINENYRNELSLAKKIQEEKLFLAKVNHTQVKELYADLREIKVKPTVEPVDEVVVSSIAKIQVTFTEAESRVMAFSNFAENTLTNAFTSFFSNTLAKGKGFVKSFKLLLNDLWKSILASLAQILAKTIAIWAVQKMFGGASGQSGSGWGDALQSALGGGGNNGSADDFIYSDKHGLTKFRKDDLVVGGTALASAMGGMRTTSNSTNSLDNRELVLEIKQLQNAIKNLQASNQTAIENNRSVIITEDPFQQKNAEKFNALATQGAVLANSFA